MKVKIETCKIDDEKYHEGGRVWVTAKLIEAAKSLPVFDLPLAHIDIDVKPFGANNTIKNFAYHMKRVERAELCFPVIMNDGGFIMNGWHRVAKALILGKESVKAVRFEKTPPHDFTEDENG